MCLELVEYTSCLTFGDAWLPDLVNLMLGKSFKFSLCPHNQYFLLLQCAPYFLLPTHKLVKAAQTKIIQSNIVFNKRGITPERIIHCFNFKMFFST